MRLDLGNLVGEDLFTIGSRLFTSGEPTLIGETYRLMRTSSEGLLLGQLSTDILLLHLKLADARKTRRGKGKWAATNES